MRNANELLSLLETRKSAICTQFSVTRIGLFGSCRRGEAGPRSDVDVLVEFTQPTFDRYMDLKFYLEDLFQAEVDLVVADSLKPRLKPIVQSEVVYA